LETVIVESDNGYIGGEYCHEFVVESEAGESKFYITEDRRYAAHEEVAKFQREPKNVAEAEKPLTEVDAVRGNTMEDGVKLHGIALWQHLKSVVFVNDKGTFVMGVVRGDLDVNEIKLAHLSKSYTLRPATEEEIRKLGSEPGFISPVGMSGKMLIVGDTSLRTIRNACTGANKKHRDFLNTNIDRDYTVAVEGDIALAKEGYLSLSGKPLIAKRGIEVGNIFQLGQHYSSRMKGASFTSVDGSAQPYYMGCYGIGLARTLATVVEMSHDEKGIIWPFEIAPFTAHLISLGVKERADEIYKKLVAAGIEVLYDDRDISAGEKFADADLIGIPVRLVISGKTGDNIEWKERKRDSAEIISLERVLRRLSKWDLIQAAA
jgi:prolyl-tRNA synthetase